MIKEDGSIDTAAPSASGAAAGTLSLFVNEDGSSTAAARFFKRGGLCTSKMM